MFDILSNDKGIDSTIIFKFDEKSFEGILFDQLSDIGYSSSNSVVNLSTLFYVLVMYLAKVLIYIIAWVLFKINGRGKWILNRLHYDVFYSDVILLTTEAFFELCISGYLELNKPLNTFIADRMSILIGYLCMILAFFVFPCLLFWVVIQDKSSLLDPKFK